MVPVFVGSALKNIGVRDESMSDGRIRLVFLVQEYPNLIREVVYQHAKHISDKDLESLTGLGVAVGIPPR